MIESFIAQKAFSSKLEGIAKSLESKSLDLSALDKPMGITQETRASLPEISSETKERLEAKDYPGSVLENIGSEAEANIYEKADLKPVEVNEKDALIRQDIDYTQKDEFGKTNLERMESGRAPLDADGNSIELHHIGQKQDSPLAELTRDEHRGKGNDNILHDKLSESGINREEFGKERSEHWKSRAEAIRNQL